MTELLYLPDKDDITRFQSVVSEAGTDTIYLEGTYFYPEGGGQPADRGTIQWDGGEAAVNDVQKDHGKVRHDITIRQGKPPEPGSTITGHVDEQRRDRLRRMHTAQHVVSRVVLDEFGGQTAGNQIHLDRSRIDFEPVSFNSADITVIEQQANTIISQNLPVIKENRARETVESTVDEGRALLDLIPQSVDPLRVVEIEGFDMCPCGGTHVSSLGEIGTIEITNHISKGADVDRIEFELQD